MSYSSYSEIDRSLHSSDTASSSFYETPPRPPPMDLRSESSNQASHSHFSTPPPNNGHTAAEQIGHRKTNSLDRPTRPPRLVTETKQYNETASLERKSSMNNGPNKFPSEQQLASMLASSPNPDPSGMSSLKERQQPQRPPLPKVSRDQWQENSMDHRTLVSVNPTEEESPSSWFEPVYPPADESPTKPVPLARHHKSDSGGGDKGGRPKPPIPSKPATLDIDAQLTRLWFFAGEILYSVRDVSGKSTPPSFPLEVPWHPPLHPARPPPRISEKPNFPVKFP